MGVKLGLVCVLVFAVSALGGCVTYGTKFEMAEAHRLIPGVTTRSEAITRLGPPNGTTHMPDGSVVLMTAAELALHGYIHRRHAELAKRA